jgi:hypothetical protein
MTRSPPSTSRTDRRRFLHDVAAAAGLAAVAGSAAGATPAATPAAADSRADETNGYRVTPHVAKYYAKARL